MLQFMHIQLLTSSLELIVNQALKMGNHSVSSLTKLEQKSLAVSLKELNATLCLSVSGEQILITSPDLAPTAFDCHIETSLSTLVALRNEQQLTELIKNDQLNIQGDIKTAQQYASLFESLNIDWLSELEKYLGDIATYKLTQLAKGLSKKVKFAQQQIISDTTEWLVHEKKLAVTGLDITHFSDQVSDVSQQFSQHEKQISALIDKAQQLLNNATHTGG